jgi:hypothetical protein
VAWGDASGVRLLDVDVDLLAYVNQPGTSILVAGTCPHGAASTFVLETSNKLLVAWGDCLMRLAVQRIDRIGDGRSWNNQFLRTFGVAGKINARGGPSALCKFFMAWELDCVACGWRPWIKIMVCVVTPC